MATERTGMCDAEPRRGNRRLSALKLGVLAGGQARARLFACRCPTFAQSAVSPPLPPPAARCGSARHSRRATPRICGGSNRTIQVERLEQMRRSISPDSNAYLSQFEGSGPPSSAEVAAGAFGPSSLRAVVARGAAHCAVRRAAAAALNTRNYVFVRTLLRGQLETPRPTPKSWGTGATRARAPAAVKKEPTWSRLRRPCRACAAPSRPIRRRR